MRQVFYQSSSNTKRSTQRKREIGRDAQRNTINQQDDLSILCCYKLCNSRIKRKRALLRHRWNLVVFYIINYKLVINVKREEGMRIPRELFLCLLSLGKLFSKLHNEPYF